MTFCHTFLSRAPFTTAFLRGFPATEMGETASERGAPDRRNAATMKRGRRKTHYNIPHVGARRTHVHIRKNCTNLVCTRPFDAGKLMSAYARAAYPPSIRNRMMRTLPHLRTGDFRKDGGKTESPIGNIRKPAGKNCTHTSLPHGKRAEEMRWKTMKTLNSVDTDFWTFLKGIPDFFRLIGAVRHQKERRPTPKRAASKGRGTAFPLSENAQTVGNHRKKEG